MNFPRFWAKGECDDFMCWRWSSQSLAEAQSLADEAARKLVERFKGGKFNLPQRGYYPDRPFREQVLQEIKNPAGDIAAVVTRNSYGCLVLNTARVMFVDIDLPEQKPFSGFFKRLFGKSEPAQPNPALSAALQRTEAWTQNHPEWGWRIYRTRAGLRLLATQDLHNAEAPATDEVFRALGADELYAKLCKNQKCFRARLTPKPWRCGINEKPDRWPWQSPEAEQRFQEWDAEYRSEAKAWATCEFLRQIGNPVVHPEVQTIIRLHDEMVRANSRLNLA